jgi:hypothetical protein
MTTPNLDLPEWEQNQSQPHVTVNTALRLLDSLCQLRVLDRDLTAPPGSPADGDCYIPDATATGVWALHEDDVAMYIGTAWVFRTPLEGWRAWVVDEDAVYVYNGAAWVIDGGATVGIEVVGADDSPDTTITDVIRLVFEGATVTEETGGTARIAITGGGGGGADASHGPFEAPAIVAGAVALDLSLAGIFSVTLTANVTALTITNPTSGEANFFTLRLAQDGTGGRTFAVPASWKFASASGAYTVSAAANEVDLLQGISYDNGTTWLVSYLKDYA